MLHYSFLQQSQSAFKSLTGQFCWPWIWERQEFSICLLNWLFQLWLFRLGDTSSDSFWGGCFKTNCFSFGCSQVGYPRSVPPYRQVSRRGHQAGLCQKQKPGILWPWVTESPLLGQLFSGSGIRASPVVAKFQDIGKFLHLLEADSCLWSLCWAQTPGSEWTWF